MKKIEFISALNHLSDETVAESADAREVFVKKRRPYLKYAAVAACAAAVISAGALAAGRRNLAVSRNNIPATEDSAALTPADLESLPKISMSEPIYPEPEYVETVPPTGELPLLKVGLGEVSMGYEGYTVKDPAELDSGNPWEMLNITSDTTLPVYRQKMWRDYEENGKIEGADIDFMREAVEFYAVNLGLDPENIEVKDRGSSVSVSCEQDGVEVEVTVTDNFYYKAYISIDDGFGLPDGARVGFYHGATREEAENAAPYLLERYEWLLGHNDAGKTCVNGSEDGSCYVTMYHPLVGYELIPYDDGTMPEESEDDIIKSIINFSLNGVEFMDDGAIHINGIPGAFEEQFEKLGDYPVITPDEALRRIDEGKYLSTYLGDTFSAEDVVYTELVYRTDGIPYYKCYVSIENKQYGREDEYTALYVPAVADEYIDGSTPWDGSFN